MNPESLQDHMDDSDSVNVARAAAGGTESPVVDSDRLLEFVRFEYRSLVVRRLQVTAEWRVLKWVEEAACVGVQVVEPSTCERCPVKAECLAAALATDDQSEWRGGVSRADRRQIWNGLERTYREVRDFELLRLDTTLLQEKRA